MPQSDSPDPQSPAASTDAPPNPATAALLNTPIDEHRLARVENLAWTVIREHAAALEKLDA